jgi:hypothetical protein
MKIAKKDQKLIVIVLSLAVVFVIAGVLIFSYSQETLDVQAEKLGAKDESIWNAPFKDYVIAGFENELSTILLGVTSTMAIFAVTFGIATILKKNKRKGATCQ